MDVEESDALHATGRHAEHDVSTNGRKLERAGQDDVFVARLQLVAKNATITGTARRSASKSPFPLSGEKPKIPSMKFIMEPPKEFADG